MTELRLTPAAPPPAPAPMTDAQIAKVIDAGVTNLVAMLTGAGMEPEAAARQIARCAMWHGGGAEPVSGWIVQQRSGGGWYTVETTPADWPEAVDAFGQYSAPGYCRLLRFFAEDKTMAAEAELERMAAADRREQAELLEARK